MLEVQDEQVVNNQQEVQNLQSIQDLNEDEDLQEDQEFEGSRRSAVLGHWQTEPSDFLSDQTSTSFLPEPCVQRLTASELLRNR